MELSMPPIEMAAIRSVRPAKRNARTHPKKQIKQIADSIKRFGWTYPLLEHFSIWRNRKGFPCEANRDSSWGLVMEASPHGQTPLVGSSSSHHSGRGRRGHELSRRRRPVRCGAVDSD